MKLPQGLTLAAMQTQWAAIIQPLLNSSQNDSTILKNIQLKAGTNTINHGLGQKLEGWKPTRVRGPATIYDTQDSNQNPQLTLVLVSSAAVVIDLEVF